MTETIFYGTNKSTIRIKSGTFEGGTATKKELKPSVEMPKVFYVMADIYTKKKRSAVMAKVKGKNTRTEIIVRKILRKMGYSFRTNVSDLPGCPDIVFPRRRKIIFIHGCFWHQHLRCKASDRPHSNVKFWEQKLDRNIRRDLTVKQQLRKIGWKTLILWECQIRREKFLINRIRNFIIS